MSATRTRRSVLAAGLALGAGAAGVALVGRPARADTAPVDVGGLTFDVPGSVRQVPAAAVGVGGAWAWCGRRDPGTGTFLVLARADLASTDTAEVLAWFVDSTLAGDLPGLVTASRRTRSVDGGLEQARLDVAYGAGRVGGQAPYRGTFLVATRADGPAGALLVLGDDRLTAGEVSGVLDTVRWTR